ncbi:hypothetical protein AZSI13_27840 [Azospira sp. I13]|nr:hypothetical protein AZSI13_27840 [Azospira sp. I13]
MLAAMAITIEIPNAVVFMKKRLSSTTKCPVFCMFRIRRVPEIDARIAMAASRKPSIVAETCANRPSSVRRS